jgi:hypothetical protein
MIVFGTVRCEKKCYTYYHKYVPSYISFIFNVLYSLYVLPQVIQLRDVFDVSQGEAKYMELTTPNRIDRKILKEVRYL